MTESKGLAHTDPQDDGDPRRSAEVAAYSQFSTVLRDAANVVESTRGLFSSTVHAVTHPRAAVNNFTNLVNYLSNSTSAAREIAAAATGGVVGQITGIEAATPASAIPGPLASDVATNSAVTTAIPTPAVAAPVSDGHAATADGGLGGLMGTVGRVASRPVGLFAETIRQVQQVQHGMAPSHAIDSVVSSFLGTTGVRDETNELRKRGDALVRISCKPEYQRRDVHPSFSNILDELLPDEARILRFLAVAGTQPAIDVRTKSLFQVGSVKLVGGVNMISEMSGCKWTDRGYQYLANLARLGLIDFSKEPIDDYRRYALLEVQPIVVERTVGVAKFISIFRSIGLTSFGRQFVASCIETDGYDGGGWATDGRQDKIVGKGPPSARE